MVQLHSTQLRHFNNVLKRQFYLIPETLFSEPCVGRERADGHGTDEPDDSGFILVKGRRKYKTERGYEAVAPVPVNVSVNEWTGKKKLVNEESKDVSRAHSFETIPLIERS